MLQCKTEIDKQEHIQQRTPKRVGGLKHLPCEEGLKELGSLSGEKRQLWADLAAAFQYQQGSYQEDGASLSTVSYTGKARGSRIR